MTEKIDPVESGKEKAYSILREKTVEVIKAVDERMKNPVGKAVAESAHLTVLSKFCQDANLKEHGLNYAYNQWKSFKALAAGTVAIIPLIGQVEGGGVASAELIDAAILEGATRAQATALAKGSVVIASGAVAESAGKVLSKEVLDGIKKGLKVIDPFEDVPAVVTGVAGVAELGGLHGALVVPALVQLGMNSYEMWSEIINTGRDVYKAMPKEMKIRFKRAKSPEIVASVAAFN